MRVLLTGVETEMSFGFSVPRASQEEDISTGGGNLGELIESQALSVSLEDSSSGSAGELQSANFKALRNNKKSVVIGDGSNNGNNS